MEVYHIVLIVVAAIALVGLIILLVFSLAKRKKVVKRNIVNIDELILALGGIRNISAASSEHKRLKITINDSSLIDATSLKQQGYAAVLAGKELKLLHDDALNVALSINEAVNRND